MPKDDSAPGSSSLPSDPSDPPHDPSSSAAPLKRGDACLYCRKRRIKCSATKPSCAHCLKLGRECIYDVGKPVSRVKMLEDKVAELEGFLRAAAATNGMNAAGAGTGTGTGQGPAQGGSGGTGSGRGSADGQLNQYQPQPPTHPQHRASDPAPSLSTNYAFLSSEQTTIDLNLVHSNPPAPGPDFASFLNFNFPTDFPTIPSTSGGEVGGQRQNQASATPAPWVAQTYLHAAGQGPPGPAGPSSTSVSPSTASGSGHSGHSSGLSGVHGSTNTSGTSFVPSSNSINTGRPASPFSMASMSTYGTNPFGVGSTSTASAAGFGQFPHAVPEPPTSFDFATLDPEFMSLVDSFQAQASTAGAGGGDAAMDVSPNSGISLGSTGSGSGVGGQHTQPSMSTPDIQAQLDAILGPGPGGYGATPHPGGVGSSSDPSRPPLGTTQRTILTVNGPIQVPSDPSSSESGFDASVRTPELFNAYVEDVSIEVEQDLLGAGSGVSTGAGAAAGVGIGVGEKELKQGYSSEIGGGVGAHPAAQEAFGESVGPEGWKQAAADAQTLVGGWFDANDLPRVARDHLLDLFFTGMKFFGQDFHIPRFYASLLKPVSRRPHPCLLYSMYLLGSKISPHPPIRALETHFHSIATRQLDEAISRADRLLDACRAATMLGMYKYSAARYHEGWMYTGTAARLAISCGLHQIPSIVFKPSTLPHDGRAELPSLMRHRSWVLPPPADAIEHGERIATFWALYTLDRCGSISTQWPPAIPDDIVSTPFPRPLHEYELGLLTEADNYTVSQIFDQGVPRPPLVFSEFTMSLIRLRALAVLERASKLMYVKPETNAGSPFDSRASGSSASVSPPGGIDEYLYQQNLAAAGNASHSSPSAGRGGQHTHRSARARTPRAYEDVYAALLRLEEDLPIEHRTPWATPWDGVPPKWLYIPTHRQEMISLYFIIGCAWMFMFDVWSFNSENAEAVSVARRLAHTVRALMGDPGASLFDIFIAMCWSFVVKILIREAKRLQTINDYASLSLLPAIESDIEVLIQALRQFGKSYNLAQMQLLRMEMYRKVPVSALAYLREKEDEIEDGYLGANKELPSELPRE